MAKSDDKYSDKEAKKRFEAALRGARVTGHKAMKDVSSKRGSEPRQPSENRKKKS